VRDRIETSAKLALLDILSARRGTVLRAWRLDLDLSGTGTIARRCFEKACTLLGCKQDVSLVWSSIIHAQGRQQLNPLLLGKSSAAFSGLGEHEAAELDDFAEELFMSANLNLNAAWHLIDRADTGSVNLEQFLDSCERLGFTGNGTRLFYGLSSSGQGQLWREEFDYLWLLTLPVMAGRTFTVKVKPKSNTKPYPKPELPGLSLEDAKKNRNLF